MEICSLFGWPLEQVMALTWPQFSCISEQLAGLRYRRACCEVFFGVAAVLDGGAKDNLFRSAPSFFKKPEARILKFTPEELTVAEARAKAYFAAKKQE